MPRAADVLRRIERFNRGREPERLAIKYAKMRKGPLAFFRGSSHLFYEDWPESHPLNAAPRLWLCGDLHVQNCGRYIAADGRARFDVCDFDDAARAPVAWEAARLCTGLLLAASEIGVAPKRALTLLGGCLDGYAETAALSGVAIDSSTRQPDLRRFLVGMSSARHGAMLRERTTGKGVARQLRLIDGKTLPAGARAHRRLERWWEDARTDLPGLAEARLLDVARRITGIGSLGVRRYVLLVAGPGGERLLDLKEAVPGALLVTGRGAGGPWRSEAARVGAVQGRAQAVPPPLLEPVAIGHRSFLLRELLPGDDKLPIDGGARLARLAPWLGRVAASCHRRTAGWQGASSSERLAAFAHGTAWRAEVIAYAQAYRAVVESDWKLFRAATKRRR